MLSNRKIISSLFTLLAAFALLVPTTKAQTSNWASVRNLIGISDATPEFQNFAARYNLSRHPILADAGLQPPQFCYTNGSGMRIFFTLAGLVRYIFLTSQAVFDPKAFLPLFGGVAPTKATILASLGLANASVEARDNGVERYKSEDQSVYVEFRGGQLQLIGFCLPKEKA